MEWLVETPDGRTLAVEDAGDRGGGPVLVYVGTPGGRRWDVHAWLLDHISWLLGDRGQKPAEKRGPKSENTSRPRRLGR